jgi:hypothetical protein
VRTTFSCCERVGLYAFAAQQASMDAKGKSSIPQPGSQHAPLASRERPEFQNLEEHSKYSGASIPPGDLRKRSSPKRAFSLLPLFFRLENAED